MLIKSVKLYYEELGAKLVVLFFMVLVGAIAEGFGVAMVLPLLQLGNNTDTNLLSRFVSYLFEVVGLRVTLTNLVGGIVLFFSLKTMVLVCQAWYESKLISDHLVDTRKVATKSIFKARFSFLATKNVGYFSNIITNELEKVNFALRQLILLLVFVVTSGIYVILPLLYEPIIAIFLLLGSIPVVCVMVFVNRWTREASIAHSKHMGRQQEFLIEALSNVKYFLSTGTHRIVENRIFDETHTLGILYRRLIFLGSITRYAFEPLAVLAVAGVVLYYTQVLNEELMGILFLIFLFRQAIVTLLAIQPAYRKFLAHAGSIEIKKTLFEDLDLNRRISNGVSTPQFDRDIIFNDVSFSYGNGNDSAVSSLNLTIPSKKKIAFVGASGSGKTTVANLVANLIEPTSGSIILGDNTYDEIDITDFSSKIAYVTQEPVIFNDSVINNITLWGGGGMKLENILDQTKLSGVVSRLDSSSDSSLTTGGGNLSGGERQRLSFARELHREFELIILDEATSSLDAQLEKDINDLLGSVKGKVTMVVIAHRLSTIKDADIINVLNEGKLVETGTFEDLVANNSYFAKMVDAQDL